MLTRALVFTAVIRVPYFVSSAALSNCLKLGRGGFRKLHESRVVYKKRKKLTDQNLVSRIMDESQEGKKEVSVVTLEDGELNSDDDIQFVAEVRRPEPVRVQRMNGSDIYHRASPLSQRCLDFTPAGEKINQKGVGQGQVKFSVLSYNVLAQELLENHTYLYKYHDPRSLHWPRRFSLLIEEIRYLSPDILCLQEVQEDHLQHFYLPALKNLGYTGKFKQRTGDKCDGCAVFWKTKRIQLLEDASVEYFQPDVPLLDRDNIGLIVRLCIDGHQLVVATTHLLYNPRRNDVRLAQVQLLLAELDRLSHSNLDGQTRHLPMILTGDFNLNPFTSVLKLITTGQLKYDELSKPRLLPCNGRASPPLGCSLVPQTLGVTDCCRHSALVAQRTETTNSVERSKEKVFNELSMLSLHHSERKSERRKSVESSKQENHMFSSGSLSHALCLNSAYTHRRHGQREATTFQDAWDTVDYIFYSQLPPEVCEQQLSLLSTWRLPTVPECCRLGQIPNADAPSDHLPLFANFLLT